MDWIKFLVGNDVDPLIWWQMSLRALICFGFAVMLIRYTGKRIFGKNTAIDIVVSVILGSNISRAVTGNAPLFATLVATVVIVLSHTILSYIAWRFPGISTYLKGQSTTLVRDGEICEDEMGAKGIGLGDLKEAMRQRGLEPNLEDIRYAYIERNGDISIIV